jgi:hypothetical protein
MLRQSTIFWLARLTVLLTGIGVTTLAAADPIFPRGERIGLEPPPGMAESRQFPGFEDRDRKVAITVLDLPGRTYSELEKSLFGPTKSGLTVEKRELFVFNGGIGYLATGHGLVGGVAMHKWLLLANVANEQIGRIATLVDVQVPDSALAAYPEKVIRAALASVTFRPAPLEERLGLLPFKLDERAGFRVMQVLPGGIVLTDGPTDDLSKQAYMIVGIGRGSPSEPDGRGRFARDLLAGAPVRDLIVVSAESMRIGGRPGYEIRARAKEPNGAPINLVQWVRFGSAAFLRVVGIARKDDWDREFTRFRAVRDGIEFR